MLSYSIIHYTIISVTVPLARSGVFGPRARFPLSCLCMIADPGIHFHLPASIPCAICHMPYSIFHLPWSILLLGTCTPNTCTARMKVAWLAWLFGPCFLDLFLVPPFFDQKWTTWAKMVPKSDPKVIKNLTFCQHGEPHSDMVFTDREPLWSVQGRFQKRAKKQASKKTSNKW